MRLKPVRFIGHEIGPFKHIELNWDKDSRHTLIVAENGMGKTTLITAMAACLSGGDERLLFPGAGNFFKRYAHDRESYAFFELDFEGETVWAISKSSGIRNPARFIQETIGIAVDDQVSAGSSGFAHSINFSKLQNQLRSGKNFRALVAAYGVERGIKHQSIEGYKEIGLFNPSSLLNPFASIDSSDLLQWITNQYVNYALAIADQKQEEAQEYLKGIQRVEKLFNESLAYPISFQVVRNPFRIEVKQNGTVLSIDQLSDGTRSFLSWTLDYLVRSSRASWENPADSVTAPGLVLIDEIDMHLHPEWQRRVMHNISHLLPETHVIATTHSPFVLASVDDAQVFQIYRDESGKLDVKASYDELYGYPADLVLEKAFVPSLYPPEMEQKLQRLSDLASKKAAQTITADEQQEHDKLLQELAAVNPWLENLLALSQLGGAAA